MTDLYIDLEWFFNQELFLVGYAYSVTTFGQLYDESLTRIIHRFLVKFK